MQQGGTDGTDRVIVRLVLARIESAVNGLCLQPGRKVFRGSLLPKEIAVDTVGITLQRERTALKVRNDQIGDGVVVVDDVALGVTLQRIEDLVQIRELDLPAIDVEND